jgi:hypothetical protein
MPFVLNVSVMKECMLGKTRLLPCTANCVLIMSNGYVVVVATIPAPAPARNSTAVRHRLLISFGPLLLLRIFPLPPLEGFVDVDDDDDDRELAAKGSDTCVPRKFFK